MIKRIPVQKNHKIETTCKVKLVSTRKNQFLNWNVYKKRESDKPDSVQKGFGTIIPLGSMSPYSSSDLIAKAFIAKKHI